LREIAITHRNPPFKYYQLGPDIKYKRQFFYFFFFFLGEIVHFKLKLKSSIEVFNYLLDIDEDEIYENAEDSYIGKIRFECLIKMAVELSDKILEDPICVQKIYEKYDPTNIENLSFKLQYFSQESKNILFALLFYFGNMENGINLINHHKFKYLMKEFLVERQKNGIWKILRILCWQLSPHQPKLSPNNS